MHLRYLIDLSDMREAQRVSMTLSQRAMGGAWWMFLLNVVVWMFIGIAFMTAFRALERDPGWAGSPLFAVLVCLVLAGVGHTVMLKLCARRVQSAQSSAFEPFPVEHTLLVSDQGLTFESRWGSSLYFWSALQEARDLPSHFAFVVRPLSVIVIPKVAFASPDAQSEFLALARGRVGV